MSFYKFLECSCSILPIIQDKLSMLQPFLYPKWHFLTKPGNFTRSNVLLVIQTNLLTINCVSVITISHFPQIPQLWLTANRELTRSLDLQEFEIFMWYISSIIKQLWTLHWIQNVVFGSDCHVCLILCWGEVKQMLI